MLLLCVALFLWLIGVPGFVVNSALRSLDTHPFRIGLSHLHVDPTTGIVASGLFLYREDDFSAPLARVQRVVLKPDWRSIARGHLALRAIALHKGSIRLPSPGVAGNGRAYLSAREIEGRIAFETNRIRLAPLNLHLFSISWQIAGDILHGDAKTGGNAWIELDSLLNAWSKIPPATEAIIAELNDVRFDPPAEAQIALQFNPAAPQDLDIHAQATATTSILRGATFDQMQADVRITGSRISVEPITLGMANHRCTVSGELDLATRQTSARLYSDLPPAQWIAVMPQNWREELVAAKLEVEGAMRSEVWLGPASLDEVAEKLHGWVSIERGSFRGIPLEKAYCAIGISKEAVHFDNLSAIIGRAKGRGPFEGAILWKRNPSALSGELRFNFDPNLVLPMLSPSQSRIVKRFAFTGEPPLFTGSFLWSEEAGVSMQGELSSKDCVYRGVNLTELAAGLSYSNHLLHLDPMSFSREEGTISGALHLDLEDDLYNVNLAGRMDPHAVAQIVGPGLKSVLEPTYYEQMPMMTARGVVDGSHEEHRTDLLVTVEGQRMGLTNWLADTVKMDLLARSGSYITTNAAGAAYGGQFTASVFVTPVDTGTSHVVRVLAAITNAELSRLHSQVRTNETRSNLGLVSGNADVLAPVHDPGWKLITGTGTFHVVGGEIMRESLFGGLSRMLSGIYPGLGFAAQDDLQGDFEIRNGKINVSKAELSGSIISMKAKGHYAFDGKIRFNVEVQLLRSGPFASVLRFITMPVTKLLIFQLNGTVQDPQWRLLNLPLPY